MIDTKTIYGGRVMYTGTELESTVRKMLDRFENPAFVAVHQYAAAGTIMNGEIGQIYQFRLIVIPKMQHWAGVSGPRVNAELAHEPARACWCGT